MAENKIYKRIINLGDDYRGNPEYKNIQSNDQDQNIFDNNIEIKNNSYLPYTNRQNSPFSSTIKNSVNPKGAYVSSNNYSSKKNFKNYFPENNSNNYLTITNTFRPKNNVCISQDISLDNTPIYFSNNKFNKYNTNNLHFNNSQISQIGYTTDEGESVINCNKNYNNHYISSGVPEPEEEKANTYDTNVEQLIIYPENENINIYEKDKYFGPLAKEGKLKNKNSETYEMNFIEYNNDGKYKNKPISFDDYILKSPFKNKKLKKTKSCENININKRNINTYEIKYFTNRKKDQQRKIKTIPINLNKKKENKISKVLEHFRGDKGDHPSDKKKKNYFGNDGDGGVVYFNNKCKREYNTFYKINKNNYKYVKFPNWKIVASACLIQSWWRSLKILYKKYLNKIIIIQKVYKVHYKKKCLLKETKSYYEPNKKCYSNVLSKYDKSKSKEKKIKNKIYNNNYIYNKPNLNQYDKKNEHSISLRNSIKHKYNLGILLLKKILDNYLIKVYNKVIDKIKNNINKYDKDDINKISADKLIVNNDKKNKLTIYADNSEPINIYAYKDDKNKNLVHLNITTPNSNISFSYKNNNFIKNVFNPEKISINNNYNFSIINGHMRQKEKRLDINSNNESKILYIQKNKNKKEINYLKGNKSLNNYTFNKEDINSVNNIITDRRNNIKSNEEFNKNLSINDKYKKLIYVIRHHIIKYVKDKIKNEVKRRKLIICIKNIDEKKYPNLSYALKKIKKYAKVRYKVINEYASIIQNAFRYYLENKKKEQK